MTDTPAPKIPKLTARQEKFCQEYAIDLNATQAALRSGYSAKTAQRIGAENLSKLPIQSRINELSRDRQLRTERSADEVVNRLWDVADFKLEHICEFDGEKAIFKPMSEWSQAARVTVRNLKQTTTTVTTPKGDVIRKDIIELKPESLISSLDAIAKQLGLYSDFNTAIAAFRRYGLNIKQDAIGKYYIEDATDTKTDEI